MKLNWIEKTAIYVVIAVFLLLLDNLIGKWVILNLPPWFFLVEIILFLIAYWGISSIIVRLIEGNINEGIIDKLAGENFI
jgi:hypothetical protein